MIDGTFSFKEDFDGDGVIDVNESASITDFTISVTVNDISVPDSFGICEPTDFTVSVSGSTSNTDNIDPDLSFSMSISSSDPLTITWTVVSGGANVTINGSLSYSDSCFTGSLTIVTTTPLFFPETVDDEIDCPTSGVIMVTGTWTGTITYTSTGGVEIDNGSDGTVDETLSDCEDEATCV